MKIGKRSKVKVGRIDDWSSKFISESESNKKWGMIENLEGLKICIVIDHQQVDNIIELCWKDFVMLTQE